MGSIRVLPPEVVNRIAAGEVVERPASVLKELLENAIDAGATEISVHLEEGGKKLIRVRDNGVGIALEDLPLAFTSHATSKLDDAQLEANLMGVASLGFRGEALASIASIAAVTMISRAVGADHAWLFRPGLGEPTPSPGELGTTLEVRDLFCAVPARRKFLRTTSTELSHSIGQLTRIALANPSIRFGLSHGGRELLSLPPVDDLGERLRQLVGREIADGLLEIRSPAGPDGARLVGFVGEPRLKRKDTREQHFFVNGRWVRDRLLAHALRASYQGYQIPGSHPVAYLFLEVPPTEVDVNVHPTKAEVRFRDSSAVYRLVHGVLRETLAGGEAPRGDDEPAARPSSSPSTVGEVPTADPAETGSRTSRLEQAVQDYLARPPRAEPAWGRGPGRRPEDAPQAAPSGALIDDEPVGTRGRTFQLLRSYILVEAEDGIVLIDQHALHEKILFEEVSRRLDDGGIESQRLLLPEVVELDTELMPLVERAAELLAPLGFEIEAFGPGSIAIHAFPALLERESGKNDLAGIVRSVVESLQEGSPQERSGPAVVRDAIRRVAATIACKRAVKAGAPLRPEEIHALLERGSVAEDPRNCPHGRPTSVFISRRELERQFDRK